MIDAASCTKQFSFKQSCRVVMGSEDASGRRRELLEDPQCLNMVLQERVARSHIFVFNGCFVAVLEIWPFVSSAHFSTATATASLYFLSALYCSALPPRCIFLHICLWPRRQWSCWQVESQ